MWGEKKAKKWQYQPQWWCWWPTNDSNGSQSSSSSNFRGSITTKANKFQRNNKRKQRINAEMLKWRKEKKTKFNSLLLLPYTWPLVAAAAQCRICSCSKNVATAFSQTFPTKKKKLYTKFLISLSSRATWSFAFCFLLKLSHSVYLWITDSLFITLHLWISLKLN